VSRDAVFEEVCVWDWSDEEIGDGEPFRMEYIATGSTCSAMGDTVWPDSPLVTPVAGSPIRSSPRSTAMPTRGSESRTPPIPVVPEAVEHATPPAETPNVDEDAEGAPLQFKTMADLLGNGQQIAANTRLTEELLAAISEEPATVEEALKSKPWHSAMMEELGSIHSF
jgi:hypothetical protein